MTAEGVHHILLAVLFRVTEVCDSIHETSPETEIVLCSILPRKKNDRRVSSTLARRVFNRWIQNANTMLMDISEAIPYIRFLGYGAQDRITFPSLDDWLEYLPEKRIDPETTDLRFCPKHLKETEIEAEAVSAIDHGIMFWLPCQVGQQVDKVNSHDVKPVLTTAVSKVKGPELQDTIKTQFRRDFKISGNIGEGPTCIGYTSFQRQLESGSHHGYSDRDLIDGVIRAIQAGSKLRGYLEGRDDLPLPKLQSIIRAFYKEKRSTELFRALELRQKINFASKESKTSHYNKDLVEHQFRHSVSTGIRDDEIRGEAHVLFQNYKQDEDLILGLNEIVSRKKREREAKLKTVKVAQVTEHETTVLNELKLLRIEGYDHHIVESVIDALLNDQSGDIANVKIGKQSAIKEFGELGKDILEKQMLEAAAKEKKLAEEDEDSFEDHVDDEEEEDNVTDDEEEEDGIINQCNYWQTAYHTYSKGKNEILWAGSESKTKM
ncbi:hypothetical protein MAR_037933 [Mya arenaria]|uniref:Uncharacterized protein n=1 Tax=Mya arenaria TaxID=6604 RepID=A0ABY7FT04_MYAAR|nr:hypothetical protein MAR_037933 [Mya arenaria]